MIVDLEKFVREEAPRWERLDAQLKRLADDPWRKMSTDEAREMETLYQRATADLARLAAFEAEPEARRYLENLVARGHAEIHGGRAHSGKFHPWQWLTTTLPQTWRRQAKAFWMAFALMIAGVAFGAGAVTFDPAAKRIIMPFPHLLDSPAERVAKEEQDRADELAGKQARFSGMLMTHNTRVTLTAMALGMTWGVGTLILMFYNGVILGAVAVDYVLGGQTVFLLGWLLPHGAIELPAMLVGGQAGFVLAGALLGRGQRQTLAARMRAVVPDVATLCFGAALMLVWAGVVEAFLSQYHEPVLPYAVKIVFGLVELVGLIWFLGRAGRTKANGGAK
jgi:uncharacterized membrane protein SpoIIM required for sporulation